MGLQKRSKGARLLIHSLSAWWPPHSVKARAAASPVSTRIHGRMHFARKRQVSTFVTTKPLVTKASKDPCLLLKRCEWWTPVVSGSEMLIHLPSSLMRDNDSPMMSTGRSHEGGKRAPNLLVGMTARKLRKTNISALGPDHDRAVAGYLLHKSDTETVHPRCEGG